MIQLIKNIIRKPIVKFGRLILKYDLIANTLKKILRRYPVLFSRLKNIVSYDYRYSNNRHLSRQNLSPNVRKIYNDLEMEIKNAQMKVKSLKM